MLSIPHMIVVFVIVLVVFGPQKLPELARGLGKLMAEFRKASTDFRSAFEEEMRDIERQAREVERRKAEAAATAATAVQPQPATFATPSGAETQPTETGSTTGAPAGATEATAGAGATDASSVEAPVLAPVSESTFARDRSAEVEAEAGVTATPTKPEDAGAQEPHRATTDH